MDDAMDSYFVAPKMSTAIMIAQDHVIPGEADMNGNEIVLGQEGNDAGFGISETPRARPIFLNPKALEKRDSKGAKTETENVVPDSLISRKRTNTEYDGELAAGDAPSTLPNKKRTSVKAKGKSKVKVEVDDVFGRAEEGNAMMEKLSVTPWKIPSQQEPETVYQTPASTPKKTTSRPLVSGTEIPKSYEDAGEADRLLWDMKSNGATWEEIRIAYADSSGKPIGGKSSLPNRYDRLKSNFTRVREKDIALLLKVKKTLEEEFEIKKWVQVADELQEEHGTPKYPAKALEKLFKKLEKEGRIRDGKLVEKDDQNVPIMAAAPEPTQQTPLSKTKAKKELQVDE